jgi:hypothetical protein
MRVAVNILSYLPTLPVMRRWDLERHVPHREVVQDLVKFMMRGFGFATAVPSTRAPRKVRNGRTRSLADAKT